MTVVEFVLLTPILIFLMFGTVELGLVVYARHVAVAAAQEGARSAREGAYLQGTAWPGQAEKTATNWVTVMAKGLVDGQVAPSQIGPSDVDGVIHPEVGVEVSFDVVTLVPWHAFKVQASSEGPVECFYTPGGVCDGG